MDILMKTDFKHKSHNLKKDQNYIVTNALGKKLVAEKKAVDLKGKLTKEEKLVVSNLREKEEEG